MRYSHLHNNADDALCIDNHVKLLLVLIPPLATIGPLEVSFIMRLTFCNTIQGEINNCTPQPYPWNLIDT